MSAHWWNKQLQLSCSTTKFWDTKLDVKWTVSAYNPNRLEGRHIFMFIPRHDARVQNSEGWTKSVVIVVIYCRDRCMHLWQNLLPSHWKWNFQNFVELCFSKNLSHSVCVYVNNMHYTSHYATLSPLLPKNCLWNSVRKLWIQKFIIKKKLLT